ncbi:MAG: hypothetical protein WDN45_14945 [Caulobacteraceae bacterium]
MAQQLQQPAAQLHPVQLLQPARRPELDLGRPLQSRQPDPEGHGRLPRPQPGPGHAAGLRAGGPVRTLAEPNLTALSGESAKFLAGGEYPVPIGEDTAGRITLEFKPYGVGLSFTPVVLSDGRISLKISTEVSELSSDGAFTLPAGGGASLTIRR